MDGNKAAYLARGFCDWVEIRSTKGKQRRSPRTKSEPPPDEALCPLFVPSTIQKITSRRRRPNRMRLDNQKIYC